ncbi:expressed unknown protein [Seminavis robusta]|uniref:Uncharacterized protein n=1 Tax=Seminavis robusta TaxID=568900 RepID=A0A9N8E6I6_9STRA|nr:expressed unknown protein [Seminavis robusta]|eukprot:Sro725_g193330.1 n/a (553) ;mRNA; r:32742-34527
MVLLAAVKRRRRSVWSLLLLLLVTTTSSDGLDLGKLFKRRGRQVAASLETEDASADPESKANEVLSYKTACDRQLAQSVVILGEQKEAAEEALTICREHRATARSDVDYLVKKVDIQMNDIETADERCNEKLILAKHDSEVHLDTIQGTLNETLAAMEGLNEEHKTQVQLLEEAHQSTLQELEAQHLDKIQKLKNEHESETQEIQKQLEGQTRERLLERQSSQASLQTTQKEHEQAIQSMQQKHKAILDAAEKGAKHTLQKIQTELNSQIETLTKTANTCDKALSKSQKAHQSLQQDHERALQKIASLEHKTSWSLFKDEVKYFCQSAEKELELFFTPLYEKYKVQAKVDMVTSEYQKVKQVAMPVLRPMLRPLEKATQRLIELHQQVAETAFSKTRQIFVQEACPMARQQLHNKKARELLINHHTRMTQAVEEACGNPTEFLTQVMYGLLIFMAFLLRWFILRTVLAILLLPLRMLVFPIVFARRMMKSGSRDAKTEMTDNDKDNENTPKKQMKVPTTPVSSNKTEDVFASDKKKKPMTEAPPLVISEEKQ